MEPQTVKQYAWCCEHDYAAHMREIMTYQWRAHLDPRDPDYETRKDDDCDEPNDFDYRTDWEMKCDAAVANDKWLKNRGFI